MLTESIRLISLKDLIERENKKIDCQSTNEAGQFWASFQLLEYVMTGKTVSGMSKKYLGICIICEYLFAVSLSLDSFPCASCRHRVRISPRLSVRGRNELTAGLTAEWESACLPCRIVEVESLVPSADVFTISIPRAFPLSS